MTDNTPNKKRTRHKGGRFIPAFCLIIGTILLAGVIISALPLAVPRLFGLEIYSVVSGSMAPALPVGSIVYVERVDPSEVKAGDIIAFRSEGTVVTHRVVQNMHESSSYITKGDANEMADISPVSYVELLGRVKANIPALGYLSGLYSGTQGKVILAFFAACGLLFRMLGSRMREHENPADNKKTDAQDKTARGEERR